MWRQKLPSSKFTVCFSSFPQGPFPSIFSWILFKPEFPKHEPAFIALHVTVTSPSINFIKIPWTQLYSWYYIVSELQKFTLCDGNLYFHLSVIQLLIILFRFPSFYIARLKKKKSLIIFNPAFSFSILPFRTKIPRHFSSSYGNCHPFWLPSCSHTRFESQDEYCMQVNTFLNND